MGLMLRLKFKRKYFYAISGAKFVLVLFLFKIEVLLRV